MLTRTQTRWRWCPFIALGNPTPGPTRSPDPIEFNQSIPSIETSLINYKHQLTKIPETIEKKKKKIYQ